jgi:hypothetical protein
MTNEGSVARVPGYDLGRSVSPAPIGPDEWDKMKATALFGDADVRALRQSRPILEPRVDELLGVWYDFVGSQPHLLAAFAGKDGQADAGYLEAVRLRFRQWVLDTASATYDQTWLDYQFEIGRRHHRTKKNVTDRVSAADHIPLRYLLPLAYPVTFTLRSFLQAPGVSAEEVEAMHQAWIKSVLLQVTLWSHPYVKDGDF